LKRPTLESLREQLDDVDRRLLELVAERRDISLAIGKVKQSNRKGTRDFHRERVVIANAQSTAQRLGLSTDFARSFLLSLIRASLTAQEQARVSASSTGDGRTALVVGGAGKMGRWFVRFLSIQGYAVEVAEPAGPVEGFPHRVNTSDGPLTHDLVVLATPIPTTEVLLHSLAKAPPPGVVFDVGSLKTPLRSGLQALAKAQGRVTSIHPMFGPDTDLLSSKHVIFVDVGCPEATQIAQDLFAPTMAQLVNMELDVHDRVMSYVLGLSHAVNIAFFTALTNTGEEAAYLSEISSTTFDAQLDVARRVADENPHLYYEIQSLNQYGLESLDALTAALAALRDAVATQNPADFEMMMLSGRSYFNAHPDQRALDTATETSPPTATTPRSA